MLLYHIMEFMSRLTKILTRLTLSSRGPGFRVDHNFFTYFQLLQGIFTYSGLEDPPFQFQDAYLTYPLFNWERKAFIASERFLRGRFPFEPG